MLSLAAAAQRAGTTPAEPATAKTKAAQPSATQPSGQQDATTPTKAPVEKREPTPQEIQVLIDGIKHLVDDSTEGLVQVTHPDGSVSIDLQGRFQNVSIAKINADGSISTECVSSQKEARQFLTTPKPAAAPTPKAKTTPTPAPKEPEVK